MSKISIKQVKEIREDLEMKCIVIFAISPDGLQHVATHGKSHHDAVEAAEMGNNLKTLLNWPKDLCLSKPLPRVCEFCEFWQRKQLGHSERIPEDWPGRCMFNPEPITRYANDIACGRFSPNR